MKGCSNCEWNMFQTGRLELIIKGRKTEEISEMGKKILQKKRRQTYFHYNKTHNNNPHHNNKKEFSKNYKKNEEEKYEKESLKGLIDLTNQQNNNNYKNNNKDNNINELQSQCNICSLNLSYFSINNRIYTNLKLNLLNDTIEEEEVFKQLINITTNNTNNNNQIQQESEFLFEDLIPLCTIGTGSFGRVKLVTHRVTNNVYALKCLQKYDIISYHQTNNILTEKQLLKECSDCEYISKLYTTYNHPNTVFILLEFIQGGEFLTHLYDRCDTIPRNQYEGFEYNCLEFYIANLVDILLYFESKQIVYRDLKPENILLHSNGYIKLIDFGFTKKLPYSKDGILQYKTFTLCGTPSYLAPEILTNVGYSLSIDYWALGCLIYEFLLKSLLFDDEYVVNIYNKILAFDLKHLDIPMDVPNQYHNLISSLLITDISNRLGIKGEGVKEMERHEFFNNFNWEEMRSRQMIAPYIPIIQSKIDTSNFYNYDEAEGREDGDNDSNNVESNTDDVIEGIGKISKIGINDEEIEYDGRQDYFNDF